jgi:hypothetical protein
MTWVKWLLVGLLVLNAMAVAASVGRPRQPITLGRAALALLVAAGLIFLVLAGWPR